MVTNSHKSMRLCSTWILCLISEEMCKEKKNEHADCYDRKHNVLLKVCVVELCGNP